MIKYTAEQELIFNEILHPTNPILAVKATAGSSKSYSLVEAIRRYKLAFPDGVVRYLIFGSMAASQARLDFGKTAIVSTLHAFAYSYVVKQYRLGEVKPFLTWRDLPKTLKRPFGTDGDILAMIEDYCTSKHLSLQDYVTELTESGQYVNHRLIPVVKQVLNQMAQGTLPVTHSFYLKLFHILVMNNTIVLSEVDRLLVDEFQDMSQLALDIINKIPAEQKVFVGDDNQAIFEFLKLQNGFEQYPTAKVLNLSKSFRVDSSYAPLIQKFLRKHLEPTAVFDGMDYPESVKPVTKAYLTRTNAKLIAKMIELNKSNTPYHLSSGTKVRDMFKLPLAIVYAKPAFDQKDPELKHLQHDIDDWGSIKESPNKPNLFKYLRDANPNDGKLLAAINLVASVGGTDLIDAYNKADEHRRIVCDLQLMTVHTSKGATRDIVELDDDVNEAIKELVDKPINRLTKEERAELCLYFVAITRHRYQLINATYLEKLSNE